MKKIKIDFIIGKMSSGGAQRVVANLANYFDGEGHSVRIITFMDGDAYKLNEGVNRINYNKKLFIKSSIIRGFYLLFRIYWNKKNRPDIISSHIGLLSFATIPISIIFRIKIIVSEHFNHLYQPINLTRKILWNFLYRYADALTILTKFDFDFFNVRNKKVIVMENPCSFDLIEQTINCREKVILAVGDLNRYNHKGFDNLIEIASKILPNHKDWKIKIVGTGDIGTKHLQELAHRFGVSNQIIFTGFRKDIKEIMGNSEIYILTSRYEGLPMVLLEALSQEMVCISFDCVSGPSEIIENNFNGVLIENQNNELMAIGLENLMKNKNFRERLRENSKLGLEKFNIKVVGKKWEKLINEIIN